MSTDRKNSHKRHKNHKKEGPLAKHAKQRKEITEGGLSSPPPRRRPFAKAGPPPHRISQRMAPTLFSTVGAAVRKAILFRQSRIKRSVVKKNPFHPCNPWSIFLPIPNSSFLIGALGRLFALLASFARVLLPSSLFLFPLPLCSLCPLWLNPSPFRPEPHCTALSSTTRSPRSPFRVAMQPKGRVAFGLIWPKGNPATTGLPRPDKRSANTSSRT